MPQRVHVVGIGGIGTSSLAVLLSQAGWAVSGSEPARTTLAGELLARHPRIRVFDEFSPGHVGDADWVVHTVAVDPDNPELAEAGRRGVPVSTYPQALGRFLDGVDVCGVAGTHGKTTTTAMIASAFERAGLPVSYLVGAPLQGSGVNARYTEGSTFVLEADEYRRAFLDYAHRLSTLLVTNIDFDHPDCYPSRDAVAEAFGELIRHIPAGARVFGCGDSPGVRALAGEYGRVSTYGFDEANAVRVELREATPTASTFALTGVPEGTVTLELAVPGRHNVLNAAGAYLAARELGCPAPAVADALESYVGARRRFDVRLDGPRVAVVDDYAHHPVAVAGFIEGLRQRYPDRRVVLVFQPHTLTRTRALFDEFVDALGAADQVGVLDVYAGREAGDPGEPGLLADRLRDALRRQGTRVLKATEPAGIVDALADPAGLADAVDPAGQPPAVIGTVGAGDLWKTVAEPLVARLAQTGLGQTSVASRSAR